MLIQVIVQKTIEGKFCIWKEIKFITTQKTAWSDRINRTKILYSILKMNTETELKIIRFLIVVVNLILYGVYYMHIYVPVCT